MKDKPGEGMEAYLILGACSPQLAHQALNVDRQIGLLLPCNVVVPPTASAATIVAGPGPPGHGHRPGREDLRTGT